MTAHTDRCQQECTRDVVFLLQRRRHVIVGMPNGVDWDGDSFWKNGDADDDTRVPECIDDLYELQDDDDATYVVEHWDTEGVWLDRQEAEAYGEAHEYNYRSGWRVYGVPSYGGLAKLLRESDL